MAFELIKDAPKRGEHVFRSGHRDNAPISSWRQIKRKLDDAIAKDRGEPLPEWHLHDLRRTAATGWQS
jgi:hypothetical protein